MLREPEKWLSMLGDLQAGLNGAACLGPWSFDAVFDRLTVSPTLADRLDLVLPMESIVLETALLGVHPADRARVENILHAAGRTGSPFEAEFRAGRGKHDFWLRLMGRAEPGPHGYALEGGAATIRGLAFDLTESRVHPGTPAQRAQLQANQLADHVIAMQPLVARLHNPSLAELYEQLTKAVGVELARHLYAARLHNGH